ncbi:D-alanyl-D-alanine carboxypeptidase family protein [Brevirhabdus sp.]|uniref:D-alanyl-D-alanine carboxypeptidase family protein n=1 Tax=Brevirhabdus sp. TaxID=2004514 RepID=UPI004058DED0
MTIFSITFGARASAAPYADFVIDARSGEVLHSTNADTRLHPASLTKMMTLYIAFQAIESGEITLDTQVRISRKAASEPPSKLGLRAGSKIAFRYLIRAASVKSANDAATAIGEALEGSEAAFARRMTRMARAMGMSRTTFKNAHGLTEAGHLSTARDMTTLGRHLFFDFPQYYNLFSRRTTDAGLRKVANTNRRFLGSYKGADGIKTGYTNAAGFNLVASAERGQERIITTVFGGRSSAQRNAKVAELMDLGFRRAPTRVAIRKPEKPNFSRVLKGAASPGPVRMAVLSSDRPEARPVSAPAPVVSSPPAPAPSAAVMVALKASVTEAVQAAIATPARDLVTAEAALADKKAAAPASVAPLTARAPAERPAAFAQLAKADATEPAKPAIRRDTRPLREVVTRASTSGGRNWSITIGKFHSRDKAERMLLQTALAEIETLDEALRKVVPRASGYEANFVGLSQERADLACRRLSARGVQCFTIEP